MVHVSYKSLYAMLLDIAETSILWGKCEEKRYILSGIVVGEMGGNP